MPGSYDTRMNHPASSLDKALRALPSVQPPDLWPQLEQRVRRGGHRWRSIGVPLAMAASLLLALLLWPAGHSIPDTAQENAVVKFPAATDNSLSALRQRSLRMEDWVRALNNGGAPLDGPALAQASRIEGDIGMVDMQLAAEHDNAPVQQALWQQRVALLQQLAALHIGQARLASLDVGTSQLIVN